MRRGRLLITFVLAAQGLFDEGGGRRRVTPIRSGPIQNHLRWTGLLFKAEALHREVVELDLHYDTQRLRRLLFERQEAFWATASPEALLHQIELSRWPQAEQILDAVSSPQDLGKMEFALTAFLSLLVQFGREWDSIKESVFALRKKLEHQFVQLSTNVQTILNLASVLQGLLSGVPGFDRCLEQSLHKARGLRDDEADFARSIHILEAYSEEKDFECHLKIRGSTFMGDAIDQHGDLGTHIQAALEATREMLPVAELGHIAGQRADWCKGARHIWVEGGPDLCETVRGAWADLEQQILRWATDGEPYHMFMDFRRRQFAAAPNVSLIQEIHQVLYAAGGLCLGSKLPVSKLAQVGLEEAAVADEQNFASELRHLADVVDSQLGPVLRSPPVSLDTMLTQPGLMGLVRHALKFQFVVEMSFWVVASWGHRISTRGDALHQRLEAILEDLEALHERIRSLPNYRRLAFEQIHSAGYWGLSGGGSSPQAVAMITDAFTNFLARSDVHAKSLVDVGCGWGEWLPGALQASILAGRLPQDFKYLGLDIAKQPIGHLRARFKTALDGGTAASFVFDVKDGVNERLPDGFEVVLVRHVFQHVTIRDALELLRNLRAARPKFVILSSWPNSSNADLADFGGSSAFAAQIAGRTSGFESYDIRKPPFSMPAPLESWPEFHGGALMLAYHGSALDAVGR